MHALERTLAACQSVEADHVCSAWELLLGSGNPATGVLTSKHGRAERDSCAMKWTEGSVKELRLASS